MVKLVAHPFQENMEINETWQEQVDFLLLAMKSCWMYESRCKQKSLFEKMNRNNSRVEELRYKEFVCGIREERTT